MTMRTLTSLSSSPGRLRRSTTVPLVKAGAVGDGGLEETMRLLKQAHGRKVEDHDYTGPGHNEWGIDWIDGPCDAAGDDLLMRTNVIMADQGCPLLETQEVRGSLADLQMGSRYTMVGSFSHKSTPLTHRSP